MSISKVKLFERTLVITNDVVTGVGPFTHTLTTATHNLTTGDLVRVSSPNNSEYSLMEKDVTVVNATSFSVVTPTVSSLIGQTVVIQYYSGGMTGAQVAMPWPQAQTPGVIQVVATGAATIVFEGSLNNTDFVNIATVTLAAAGTDYFLLDCAWAYIRANITSIAATKLAKIYRSV